MTPRESFDDELCVVETKRRFAHHCEVGCDFFLGGGGGLDVVKGNLEKSIASVDADI